MHFKTFMAHLQRAGLRPHFISGCTGVALDGQLIARLHPHEPEEDMAWLDLADDGRLATAGFPATPMAHVTPERIARFAREWMERKSARG